MEYTWVFLSLLAAFGHAFGWAMRKKVLQVKGVNNTLGCMAALGGGATLYLLWLLGSVPLPVFTNTFFVYIVCGVIIDVLSFWAAHRAMEHASISLLMPFVSLSALIILPFEYVMNGLIPTWMQIVGVLVIVSGALVLTVKGLPDRSSYKAMAYYSITIISCAIIPVVYRGAIHEIGSPFLTFAIVNISVAFGFLCLMFVEREGSELRRKVSSGKAQSLLLKMLAVGVITALLNQAPTAWALLEASASEVVALKRTMPFFALLLGIYMFKERVTLRHFLGTALLVIGCVLVVLFQ